MNKKRRTHSLRLIKDNYTYNLEQIADLFDVNVTTVRRWISNEGLQRIPKTRPYLVHSSDLKKFLDEQQKARKRSCKPYEAYCCKCHVPRQPEMGTGKAIKLPNGCVRFQGQCERCGIRINRVIKGAEWSEKHPLAAYLHDAKKQHNGAQSSHRESHIQEGEQLCLNITPKTNA